MREGQARPADWEAFRIIDIATEDVDLGPVIAPYGCEGDLEATLPIIERYGLTLGWAPRRWPVRTARSQRPSSARPIYVSR